MALTKIGKGGGTGIAADARRAGGQPVQIKQRSIFKTLRASLMGTAAVGALAVSAPQTALAEHEFCDRNGAAVECNGGLQGGLTFIEGGPDSSGAFPSPATEFLDVRDLEREIFVFGPAITVEQTGNVTVNIEGRDEFLVDLSNLAGPDGTFTIAELGSFIAAMDEGPSAEETAAFLALLQTRTGVDTSSDAAVVSVEDAFAAGVALGRGFEVAFAADTDGNVALDAIAQALPGGLPQSTIDGFLANLPVQDGVVPVADAVAAVQTFILDGNIGDAADAATIIMDGSLFGALGIQVSSAHGAVEINNSANLVALDGEFVLAIAGGSGNVAGDSLTAEGGGAPVRIVNHGDITVSGGIAFGILAGSGTPGLEGPSAVPGGDVRIDNHGDIVADGDTNGTGIFAISNGGNVSVFNSGNVTATTSGIEAVGFGAGAVSIDNSSDVHVTREGTGLSAEGRGSGAVSVISAGAILIDGETGQGISARNEGQGDVLVDSSAAITNNTDGGTGISAFVGSDNEDAPASGGNVSVSNSGPIHVNGSNSFGIEAGSSPEAAGGGVYTITTSGDIIASGADSYAIAGLGGTAGRTVISVESGALVQGGSGATHLGLESVLVQEPVDANGDGEPDFHDYYSFERVTGAAGVLFAGGTDNVLNNSGTITALNGQAISTFSGDVTFQEYDFFNWTDFSQAPPIIEHTETIAAANETVNNSGTINGDVALGEGNNALNNELGGTVTGNVTMGSGNDSLVNRGQLTGNTDLGDGSNQFENSGTVTGNVTTGAGDDTYQNDGTHTGNVALGDGTNSVTNTSSLTLNGNVSTGSGADSYNNSGVHNGNADLGDGNNIFSNLLGSIFGGNLTTGSGNDDVNNAGVFNGDLDLGGGDDSVTNSGVLVGNVDLGAGNNSLSNTAGGVFNSGANVNLGAGGAMTNAGTLSPSGITVIGTTAITGNLTQSDSGQLVIDIDDSAAQRNDVIAVTGTADLAGLVVPNVINLAETEQEFVIITAANGIINSGLAAEDLQAGDTVGFDFELVFGDTDVTLTSAPLNTVADIAAAATTGSAGSAGATNIQGAASVLDASTGDGGNAQMQELVTALRLLPDSAAAGQALERLVPNSQGAQASGAATGGTNFSNAMLSCQVHSGDFAYTREGQCYWAKITARKLDRSASGNFSGIDETGYEIAGGIQFALRDELRFGFALGYEDTSSKSSSNTQALGTSDGKSLRGGIVLKNQWGPLNAYLNLAGSYGWYDHDRFVNLGGAGIAKGEQNVGAGLSRLRVSYIVERDGFYIRPMLDLNATYVHLGGYTETGAGGANLIISSADKWLLSVAPSVEFGGEIELEDDTIIRPYLRAGISVFNDDRMNVEANFANAPAGIQSFMVTSNLEDLFADVEAGVHVLIADGVDIRLTYDGRFSEATRQHAGSIKVGKKF